MDIDGEAAEQVAREIRDGGGVAEAMKLDVADESGWMAVIERIVTRFQGFDVLVNNAGVSIARPIAETALDEWQGVLRVNLDGVFLGTNHGILAMRSHGGGSIINVASVSGITPYPEASASGASKAAVRHFSKIASYRMCRCQDGYSGQRRDPGRRQDTDVGVDGLLPELVAKQGGREAAFAAMAGTSASNQISPGGHRTHNPLPCVRRVRSSDGCGACDRSGARRLERCPNREPVYPDTLGVRVNVQTMRLPTM